MPSEEHQSESHPSALHPGAPSGVSDGHPGAATAQPPAATPLAPDKKKPRPLWMKVVGAFVLLVALVYGAKSLIRALNTVSTDDAYVNGHVTFVAARVPGQVTNVYVDDNNRVNKGDLIVQLDKEPYEVQLELKLAELATAKANVVLAQSQVRGIVAQARSNRYRLEHAIEGVNDELAKLKATAAQLKVEKANLVFAESDYKRLESLVGKGAVSQQDFDKGKAALDVAKNRVAAADQDIQQIRAGLGLPIDVPDPLDVPKDLDQTFSTVREALSNLLASVAPLNVQPSSYSLSPKEMVDEFYKRDPEGNLDRIYAKLVEEAPAIKEAQAKLMEAQSELDQAKLNLRYCDVFAEISGVVTRRNVNPGNNVQAGQALMAIRSLSEIWVDANFKETQLAELRIGQRVELDVDMYGRRRVFEGRISGFTMGTGSTLALLPAQNATGNFIKVVQRLPVRIELVNYDPDKEPLFIGLSVVPYVLLREKPEGPSAGKVLQPPLLTPPATKRPSTTAEQAVDLPQQTDAAGKPAETTTTPADAPAKPAETDSAPAAAAEKQP